MSAGSAIESCVATSGDGSGPALFLRSGRAHLHDSAIRHCVSPAGEAGAIHVSSKSALYAYTLLLANCSAPQAQRRKRQPSWLDEEHFLPYAIL
eukprot:6177216-Pleurochrysis_carterae.AAC.2